MSNSSLPSRERGLKYSTSNKSALSKMSLPSRERGLKFVYHCNNIVSFRRSLRGSVDWNGDAWVSGNAEVSSLPSRERGLKFSFAETRPSLSGRSLRGSVDWNLVPAVDILCRAVAPFAGAWIEMYLSSTNNSSLGSLPSRERGLKFGTKHTVYGLSCRSLRGSVDWNSQIFLPFLSVSRRSLRGSVDWNWNSLLYVLLRGSRSLRGSVDWNLQTLTWKLLQVGRSLRGSVDWNRKCQCE